MPTTRLSQRQCLQLAIAVGGIVPVLGGLWGILDGPSMLANDPVAVAVDSHWRYLSGLLMAIGLGFWSTIPDIEHKGARFLSLSSLVVTGGIGRLISLLVVGIPSPLMIFALVMELGVTPAMAFWQHQISKRSP